MSENHAQLQQIRHQFPLLQQRVNGQALIYLDNAATTQKPQVVLDCIQQYYRRSNANVHRASHALSADATQRFEQARSDLARYLNAASAKEIIWTRGATEAINLVAQSWGSQLQAGDEILLSTLEHHANIVPWQMLAARSGAQIKAIPLLPNGDLDQVRYRELLNSRTKMVAIGHVSNALGTINPIQEMISAAHAVGARVLIDGAQALPHFQVDVQALDADFYVFSGHKLFAPTGIGVLYGKQALLEAMPPWQGGGEMIEQVSFNGTSFSTTFNTLPFKFEAGTPNISGAIALAAAVNWLTAQDRVLLEQHEQALFDAALDGCSQIKGWQRIAAPQAAVSLLSFTLSGQHQQDIGLLLDQQGIAVRSGHHCAMPLMQQLGLPGTTRASFAFYNTLAEVEHFVRALDEIALADQVQVSVSAPESATASDPDLLNRLCALRSWNERYREIMLLGKNLPGLTTEQKTPDNLVKGCESNTWLWFDPESQRKGAKLHFSADSDARIIRGLLAIVLAVFDNKTAAEIQQTDIESLFSQLDLHRHLSPSRGNGLKAVIDRIYEIAAEADR